MLAVGVSTVAVHAEPVERRDAHLAVKLPSEPPPTSGALSSTKPISRAMAAARSKTDQFPDRARRGGG